MNIKKPLLISTAIAAAALVVCAPDAFGQSVGVNFNGVDSIWGGPYIDNGQTTSLQAGELAGAPGFAQTNWNNINRYGDVTSGFMDTTGADSGLHMMWDSVWCHSSGVYASLGTANAKLMDSFNDTDWAGGPPGPLTAASVYGADYNQKPLTYVGGLQAWLAAKGASSYAVVMYVQGWHSDWWRTSEHWVQGVASGNPSWWNMVPGTDLTPHIFSVDSGNNQFNGSFNQMSSTATNFANRDYNGNFIVFSGLTADAILLRTAEPDGAYQAGKIMGFQIILNHAPVAGSGFTMGAVSGIPTTVPIVGGKFAPTDADNDPLTIASVTGAANGTVSTDGANITYTATSGTTDSFTYTVSDGKGGTATRMINVTISGASQGFNQLGVQMVSGNAHLSYLGMPGYKYALDWTHSLTPPVTWLPLVTNTAAGNGALLFTNTPSGGSDFYRTRYVP